jgi:2-polyprenyl-3-methyl-5-hydroxy-6-metoxy-1,4-benzoquinol methylase
MSRIFTTEITSDQIPSDNPIHQRLYKAYVVARDFIHGEVLEVGCGEGRGVELLMQGAEQFTAVDKIASVIQTLQDKYHGGRFISMNIPPLTGLEDNAYDVVVSFQVIEHIENDGLFLKEIERVLRPGGTALLTTPNRSQSLTRNPWHVREYLPHELEKLAQKYFAIAEVKGITGNEKVMSYYEENRKAVRRFTRWDPLDLQHRLPAFLLRIPYELLNRWNRNKLQSSGSGIVQSIRHEDYLLTDDASSALDLLLIAKKHT